MTNYPALLMIWKGVYLSAKGGEGEEEEERGGG